MCYSMHLHFLCSYLKAACCLYVPTIPTPLIFLLLQHKEEVESGKRKLNHVLEGGFWCVGGTSCQPEPHLSSLA